MEGWRPPDVVFQPNLLKIPPNPLLSKERLNPAEWMYERLVKQIIDFESTLSTEEEIGGRFVTSPKDGAIHIENVGYWNPDMLIFQGKDFDGRPIKLLQHYSQLSVLLCAMPAEKDNPRRIGFILDAQLKAAAK